MARSLTRKKTGHHLLPHADVRRSIRIVTTGVLDLAGRLPRPAAIVGHKPYPVIINAVPFILLRRFGVWCWCWSGIGKRREAFAPRANRRSEEQRRLTRSTGRWRGSRLGARNGNATGGIAYLI